MVLIFPSAIRDDAIDFWGIEWRECRFRPKAIKNRGYFMVSHVQDQ